MSDRLVDVVRDFILSGAIASDVPIRQDALAAELRVSKIPLREALARLEQDGLVVSHPNRGFFVRPMSRGGGRGEFMRCASSWSPTPQRMPACAPTMRIASARARRWREFDVDAAAQKPTVGALNRAFHLALVRPGGQRVTTNIVARLHVLADRYVRKHLEPKGRFLNAEAEHHEMLDAWIKRRDARVRKLITQHLEHTLADLRSALRPAAAQGSGGAGKKRARR